MNLSFYLEKLHSSDKFKKFKKENPSAYLCSGFFILDKEGKQDKISLDYTKGRGIFSFQVDEGVEMKKIEGLSEKSPENIGEDFEFDFSEIESLIENEMKKQNIKSKIQKIILSLQSVDGKTILAGTVFISMLGMIKISISLPSKKIEEFEKKSLFDIIQIRKKD